MSEQSATRATVAAFDLGLHMAAFRCYAEHCWASTSTDEQSLSPLYTAMQQARQALDDLTDAEWDSPDLASIRQEVETEYGTFREAWVGKTRGGWVVALANVDGEFEFPARCKALESMPIDAATWDRIDRTVERLGKTLDPTAEVCLKLSRVLGRELFGCVGTGVLTRSADEERAAITVALAQELGKAIEEARVHLPALTGVRVDLTSCRDSWEARPRLAVLRDEIRRRLEAPGTSPGHLGLVVDREKGQISRAGFGTIRLAGQGRWDLLCHLARNGETLTSADELKAIHHRGGNLSDTRADALQQMITSLRKALKPLGLTVSKSYGRVGYRIEETTVEAGC